MAARCPHRAPWFACCYECEPPDDMLAESRRPLDGSALADAFAREMLGQAVVYVRAVFPDLTWEQQINLAAEIISERYDEEKPEAGR